LRGGPFGGPPQKKKPTAGKGGGKPSRGFFLPGQGGGQFKHLDQRDHSWGLVLGYGKTGERTQPTGGGGGNVPPSSNLISYNPGLFGVGGETPGIFLWKKWGRGGGWLKGQKKGRDFNPHSKTDIEGRFLFRPK